MQILWWGRGDNGYSRNGVIRACLRQMGHEIVDFRPRTHWFADWEARLKGGRDTRSCLGTEL